MINRKLKFFLGAFFLIGSISTLFYIFYRIYITGDILILDVINIPILAITSAIGSHLLESNKQK